LVMVGGLRRNAAPSLGVPSSFALGHPAPNSVRLNRAEGVVAARDEDGAALADLPRQGLTCGAGVTAFLVGRKEHRHFETEARGARTPLCDVLGFRQ
jgi:hypothetical protein